MKLSPLHASLLTLAIFAAAASAHAAADNAQPLVLAQADNGDASAEFEQIAKFLSRGADVSGLDDGRLQQRLSRAQRFQQVEGLPPDLAGELDQQIAAMSAEIERRQQAAAEAPAAQPEEQPQETPRKSKRKQQAQQEATDQQQAEPEQPKQVTEEAAPPQQDSPEVAAFLNSVRPASELSADELRQQMERAAELAQTGDLSQDQRRALRNVIREARAELRNKQEAQQAEPPQAPVADEQQAQPEQPKQTEPPKQEEQTAAPQASEEVAAFLSSVKPASELSEDALRQQMRRATELAGTDGLPAEQRQALRDVIREARAALRNTGGDSQQTGEQAQPDTQQPADQQAGQSVQVDPELESKALAIVNDMVDVTTMDRRELRQRLTGIRELLASDKLSPQTTEALRQKLAAERQVLRNEVSESESKDRKPQDNEAKPADGKPQDQTKGQGQRGGTVENNNVTINNTTVNNTTITNTEIRVVLQDRRPADVLDQEELVRRIDVYRDVAIDDRYDEAERRYWRRALEQDRRELRRRMLDDRRQREEYLRSNDTDINIVLGFEFDPGRDYQDDVFAAEVDDEELVDVLAAPPRRKLQRRYTVDEIETSRETRDAVARIEIDTVHFGFGEGFLREEEIDKLDRIAQILERILAKNPGEVFMIEGHTDAVGSDASNLVLSRQRAKAVKEALTTYYVIPSANLKTVGLGERYLKIPTQRPEAENRRVSLARITPLVGELD